MPITQERMQAVIAAARDYQQGLETVRIIIANTCRDFQSGAISTDQFLQELQTLTRPSGLLSDAVNTERTIALESRHFHSNAKRNIRDRERQRQRRVLSGLPPYGHTTAPRSLDHTPHPPTPNTALSVGLVPHPLAYLHPSAAEIDPLAASARDLSPERRAQIDVLVTRLGQPEPSPAATDIPVEAQNTTEEDDDREETEAERNARIEQMEREADAGLDVSIVFDE